MNGLAPNVLTGSGTNSGPNSNVTVVGVSLGASLTPGYTGVVNATQYTQPTQLSQFAGFTLLDWALYGANQLCQ